MAAPSDRDLRLFSELSYSDLLTEYFNKQGAKTLNHYVGFSDEYLKNIKDSLHFDFEMLFSNWELVTTLQNIIKTRNLNNNPLLDGFVFRNIFDETFVIAFRGTNFTNKKQKKEDMVQNLSIFLAESDTHTQLGQAELLTKAVIKGYLGIDPHQPRHSLLDLSDKIFITGHSKGGGLTQGVVCILREEFYINVQGVTFSPTPIYLLTLQLENPSMDWKCRNYILTSDRVLYGLSILRFWKLRSLIKKSLKNNNIKYPIKKLRLSNLVKLRALTNEVGSSYVGGITILFESQPDSYKHSLWHYDLYFDSKGNFPR